MSLPDDIRVLADRLLARLAETQDFYVHTRQAWRVVQQIAHEGRPVGIVDAASKLELPAPALEPLAQRYVTVYLPESVFKGLAGLLEDWIIGLARLWLTAHPERLDPNYSAVTGRTRKKRQEEIQIPLSHVLSSPDRGAILGAVIERVVRGLTYERPEKWFQFIDARAGIGCPDDARRAALCELKATRDVLEHNRGEVNQDYRNKAGAAARYAMGDTVQIEDPYLLECFRLLRAVIEEMATAAIHKSSGAPSS